MRANLCQAQARGTDPHARMIFEKIKVHGNHAVLLSHQTSIPVAVRWELVCSGDRSMEGAGGGEGSVIHDLAVCRGNAAAGFADSHYLFMELLSSHHIHRPDDAADHPI